jgi:LemA protein
MEINRARWLKGKITEAVLKALVEKYPDIKSQQNYVRLQDQIAGTERRIKFSRNDFNKAIQGYNTSVRSFPSSLVASIFSFKVKDGFKADIGSEKAPEITFTK